MLRLDQALVLSPAQKVNDDVLPFQGGKCVLGIDNVADTLGLTLSAQILHVTYTVLSPTSEPSQRCGV